MLEEKCQFSNLHIMFPYNFLYIQYQIHFIRFLLSIGNYFEMDTVKIKHVFFNGSKTSSKNEIVAIQYNINI